jgi:hypothetical protein
MNKENNFFSNTNPDLISSKSIAELTKIVEKADPIKKASLSESTLSFYKKYIQPNLLPLIIVIIFITFMIYRYMTNSDKENKEKFDPNKSVNDPTQTELELSETDKHYEFDNVINEVVKDKEMNEILNDDSIYENLLDRNEFNDREVFRGTHNQWDGEKDDEMEHPYGYDNRYIETTNNMVDFATKKNKSALDEAFNRMFL